MDCVRTILPVGRRAIYTTARYARRGSKGVMKASRSQKSQAVEWAREDRMLNG
jgi:hypothetical protein